MEQEFNVNLGYPWDLEEFSEEEWERAKKLREQIPVPNGSLPRVLHEKFKSCDEFLIKLRRYESQFEGSMYKALRQLERLQARRQGRPMLAPLAVDLDVHGVQPQNN